VSQEVNVLEYASDVEPRKVDRKAGVIHDVKIIGTVATDGRRYSQSALTGAKTLYEGARVNVNHPSAVRPGEDRNFHDWFGTLQNVREGQPGEGGLRGDLHYLKSHSLAETVCEAAERFPKNFGLSHNAVVQESQVDGTTIYHAINRVRSVDIVCRPATTRGIFESEGGNAMDPNAPPVESPAAAGSGDMTLDIFLTKATEIFKGDGDGSSKASAIGKLAKTLFKVADQLDAAVNGGDTSKPADNPTNATESVKELDKLRRELAARDVLESEGVPYGESRSLQISALAGLDSDEARRSLAKTWKPAAGGQNPGTPKPKSTPANVLESQGGGKPDATESAKGKYDDPRQAAAALMGRG
jgi:hypothetical protein